MQFTERTHTMIVFVHGWAMTVGYIQSFSDTSFKRLYWQGYAGRFLSFTWPTEYFDTWNYLNGLSPYTNLWNYDRSAQKESVTFTANVTGTGVGTPTGTVTFTDGATALGTGVLNAAGVATFTTSSLSLGIHSITATYAGDSFFTASASTPASQVVNQAATTTTVSSSSPTSTSGQPVTFTATIAPVSPSTGIPTGFVQFVIDGVNFASPVALVNGIATSAEISTLTSGPHSIVVVYLGDPNFTASTSTTLTQTVSGA